MQFDKLTFGINFISIKKQLFHIDLKINPVDIKHESSFSLLTDIFTRVFLPFPSIKMINFRQSVEKLS